MVEQEKPKKSVVKTTSIVAAGMASVVAALFTSRLGVAGTLIGAGMTSMIITLTSAILNSQLEKASSKLSGLPSTARGRLSTQQVRTPATPNAEPNPVPPEQPPEMKRMGRSTGILERLRSIPGYLKGLSPTARRGILISGALAGVAATVIALSAITFTEAVAGEDLSSLVWSQGSTASGTGGAPVSDTSIGGFFNGASGAGNQYQQYPPSGGEQPAPPEQPTPGGNQQYRGPLQQPAPGGGQLPQDQEPVQPVPEQPAAPSGQ